MQKLRRSTLVFEFPSRKWRTNSQRQTQRHRAMLATLSHILFKKTPNLIHCPQFVWLFRAYNSWAIAIRKASTPHEALELYTRMQREQVRFDSFSIVFALKSCTNLNNLPTLRHMHAHILKLGFISHVYVATSLLNVYVVASFDDACCLFHEMVVRNTVTWNSMIMGYSRFGEVGAARKVFDQMPVRDLFSWSAVIAGYMNNCLWDEGLALFREMVTSEGLKPDQIVLSLILPGCGQMGSAGLVLGKAIHAFVVKNEWELDVEIGTCLVDMYAKCGFLKYACFVFDRMTDWHVVAWTALIHGFAEHGCGTDALIAFQRMRECGVMPNELTFTALLTACARAGLVEEGRRYFRMIEEYGLRPTIQHYGCMVDLFGKAGLLGEAYEVIRMMPSEPNVVVWRSFLLYCKWHKQFEMAERVIEQIMRTVRPENDGGVYSLISNLYILYGKLGEAQKIREYSQSKCRKY